MPWTQRKQLQYCQVARGHLVDFHLSWQAMRFAQDVAGSPQGEYTKGPNFRFHATMELGRLHGALKPWYKLKYSKLNMNVNSWHPQKTWGTKTWKIRRPNASQTRPGFRPRFHDFVDLSQCTGQHPQQISTGMILDGGDHGKSHEKPWNPVIGISRMGKYRFFNEWDRIQYYLTFLVVDKRDEYETIWLKHDQSLN